MEIADYIPLVKRKLSESSIVNSFTIVDEIILFDRGYFRATVLRFQDTNSILIK